MERYKLKTMLLSDEDVRVFLESLDRSAENFDVPHEDRVRARKLREELKERFDGGE